MLKRLRGQSTLEYALVIAAIVGALIMMQIYLKRGVGGRIKSSADDIGEQFDPVAYSGTITYSSGGSSLESASGDSVAGGATQGSNVTVTETNIRTDNTTLGAWGSGELLKTTAW